MRLRGPVLVVGVVCLVLGGAMGLGLFETWQSKLADAMFSEREVDGDIVIVAIDEKSIESIGRWPWSRRVHAELFTKLSEMEPTVVGMDIAFLDVESGEVDGELAEAMKKVPNVVLAAERVEGEIKEPLESLRKVAKSGVVNLIGDSDGVVRRVVIDGSFAEKVWGGDSRQGLERINFVGPPGSFKRFSYADVLAGNIREEEIRNKTVLVGATAADLHDNQMVPVSAGRPMDGVEIQANIIQMVKEERFLKEESRVAGIARVVLVGVLLVTAMETVEVIPGLVIMASGLVVYLVFAVVSFDGGRILDVIYTPLTILMIGGGETVYKYFSEKGQKEYIRKAFSHYLSAEVMEEVLKDPEKLQLGGERQMMTVLFSDIAGFTSMSEKLPADMLAGLLNRYLTAMTKCVFDNKGVLDKYIGDAVMAFWGAPVVNKDHALAACKTAMEMVQRIKELEPEWEKAGVGELYVRIGINTGEMAVGNMGSEMRFDYTLVGDNVNLGSRLEGINKVYGTKVIISQGTYEQVRDQVTVRRLDKVAVKGKQAGIYIYELIALGSPDKDLKRVLEGFEEARRAFEEGDFRRAEGLFARLKATSSGDRVVQVYLDRLKELNKGPVDGWDGVYRAQEK